MHEFLHWWGPVGLPPWGPIGAAVVLVVLPFSHWALII